MTKRTPSTFLRIGIATWLLLLALAFVCRTALISKSHITFTSDEASCLNSALHFGSQDWQDRLYPAPRYLGGIRFWVSALFYRLTGGWLRAGAFEAILFNLLGCTLWVYWFYRWLSTKAAFVAALFLAIPPACLDYFATLLERRQVSFVLGAVLALGWEKWQSNARYAVLFGLLLGWAFWEDRFILAFVVSLFLGTLWAKDGKKIWKAEMWKWSILGVLLSGGYGLFREWQQPQYGAGYLTYGFAASSAIFYRLHLLMDAFPQFWNDNMPTGLLQASALGQAVDPMRHGSFEVGLRIWTVLLFAAALGGYGLLVLVRKGSRALVLSALLPVVLLLFFFLLSDHVSDALCFRYFTYWPVGIALGLGSLLEATPEKRKKLMGIFLGLLFLIQTAIFVHRVHKIPAHHPAEQVIAALDHLGLKAGWANGWVSGAVDFISGDRIYLNQYNFEPADRKAEWLAYHSPRIAVVSVDGLDRPELIRELLSKLENLGYHSSGGFRFKEGWTLIELRKSPT